MRLPRSVAAIAASAALLGAAPPETSLVEGEARAGKAYAAAQAELARWCLARGLPIRARWILEEALRWDPGNGDLAGVLAAAPEDAEEPADPRLQDEVQARQKALARAHATALASLAAEAIRLRLWLAARRLATEARDAFPGAEGLEAAEKALSAAAADLRALDSDLETARAGCLARPAEGGLPGHRLLMPGTPAPCPLLLVLPRDGGEAEAAWEPFRKAGVAVLVPAPGKGEAHREAAALLRLADRWACEAGLDRRRVLAAGVDGPLARALINEHRGRLRGLALVRPDGLGTFRRSAGPDPFPLLLLVAEEDQGLRKTLVLLQEARLTGGAVEALPEAKEGSPGACAPRILAWARPLMERP